MKLQSTFIFVLILLALFLPFSYANMYCSDSMCSGQYSCFNSFCGFGTKYADLNTYGSTIYKNSAQNYSTYTLCESFASPYRSLVYDYDHDYNNEIFLIADDKTHIYVYSSRCELDDVITVNNTILSDMALSDVNNDNYNELVVIANNSIYAYNASNSLISYKLIQTNLTSVYELYKLACTDDNCWLMNCSTETCAGTGTLISLNSSDNFSTKCIKNLSLLTGFIDYVGEDEAQIITAQKFYYYSLSSWKEYYNFISYDSTLYLAYGISVNDNCSVYDYMKGSGLNSSYRLDFHDLPMDSFAGWILYNNNPYFYYGGRESTLKSGTSYFDYHLYSLVDRFDNLISNVSYPIDNYTSTLISVGDFNKDGSLERIFMYQNMTLNNDTILINGKSVSGTSIFASTFNRTLLNFSFPSKFVIADFNASDDHMYIATIEGIFDIDDEKSYNENARVVFRTNLTDNQDIDADFKVWLDTTYTNPLSITIYGNPVLSYNDGTKGYIFYPNSETSGCGNAICDGFETIWTCPADCINETTPSNITGYIICTSNSDCTNPAYPTCLMTGSVIEGNLTGQCVASYNASLTCTNDDQCPVTTPICYLHYCVAGVEGGAYPPFITEDTAYTTSSPEGSLQALMDQFFQGSKWLKFIIGLVIIVVIAAEAGNLSGGNPFVITLGGGVGLVAVTVLGLVPVYVLILIILLMVLLLIFSRVLFPNVGVSK